MSISNEIQMVVLEVCNLNNMISFYLIIQSISITGYAFVTFKNVEALKKVLAKQGHMIKGQKAYVAKAKPASADRGGFRGGIRGRGKLRGSFRGRGGYSDRGGYNDRGGFRGGFRGRGRAGHHVQLVQNFY